MKPLDIAVIGSGIGGALIAALNKEKNLILFEKDKNLGGCASTFKKDGYRYNTGATTFVGYENNHPIKNIFEQIGFTPNLKKSAIAIRIIQNNKKIDRVKDFDIFLENLNQVHPHKNNRKFWKKIKAIDEKFWSLKKLYYAKYSFNAYMRTILSSLELFDIFGLDLFKSAQAYIQETLRFITKEYQDFIDAQLLITVQTTSKEISLLSLALGLSYPFHDVFYVSEGMGTLFASVLKDNEVHKNEEILSIKKEHDLYQICSNKNEYLSKQVILNSTLYDAGALFEDEKIKNYYNQFTFNDQSAFVFYLKLNSKNNFLEHYQMILEEQIPYSISNAFFISFSQKEDKVLSKDGYSITISTHTKTSQWTNLSLNEYEKQKKITEDFILHHFLKYFESIEKKDIIHMFSATPKTFKRYINRFNCGGRAITLKNIFQTPSCTTPFKGLYNVGDSVFAGQGWPGVGIGVQILNKELNEQ